MSLKSANDCKPAATPAPDGDNACLTNHPLAPDAVPIPDAALAEAQWRAAHVPQNRRLIAAIRER